MVSLPKGLGPVLAKRWALLHWFCVMTVRLSCDLTWSSPKIFNALTWYCNAESKKKRILCLFLKILQLRCCYKALFVGKPLDYVVWAVSLWMVWVDVLPLGKPDVSVAQCWISASHCCPPVSCQTINTLMSRLVWNCIMIYVTICILEIAHDTATFLMYS